MAMAVPAGGPPRLGPRERRPPAGPIPRVPTQTGPDRTVERVGRCAAQTRFSRTTGRVRIQDGGTLIVDPKDGTFLPAVGAPKAEPAPGDANGYEDQVGTRVIEVARLHSVAFDTALRPKSHHHQQPAHHARDRHDSAPAPAAKHPAVVGDPIGRWEGDTLVVDTTNLMASGGWRSAATSTRRRHLVERLTMKDSNTIEWT